MYMKQKTKKIRSIILIMITLFIVIFASKLAVDYYYQMKYPVKYKEIVLKYCDTYHVPYEIVFAVIATESKFNPKAVSSADAKGLMQITKENFEWLKYKMKDKRNLHYSNIFEVEVNIQYGTYFLSILYKEFNDWNTAFAAYNAGRTRVMAWLADDTMSENNVIIAEKIPYPETKNYVIKIRKAEEYYKNYLPAFK